MENEKVDTTPTPRTYEIVYLRVLYFVYVHVAGFYGAYLAFTTAKWMSIVFACYLTTLATVGITIGAHRMWAHKAFKAKLILEIFLMLCQSVAGQFTAYDWIRDHRAHHKYCDTDADPHNSRRGFFYSHIGWLLVKRHPEVKEKGATINMEDIRLDPVLGFQRRHWMWLLPTAGFLLPTIIPFLLWNEDITTSWHLNQLRYMISLNMMFSINSFSHLWGYRPYDTTLTACQNMAVVILSLGEGYHNFHHAFPFDYRASERGSSTANFSMMLIDVFAKLGLAYDLKAASEEVVKKRKERTGVESDLWGYGK